jgi:uncharacterized membrane protein
MICWPDLELPPINLWSLPNFKGYYMKIETGKSYLTRSGMVVTVVDLHNEHLVAITNCGQKLLYNSNGKYIHCTPATHLDLIVELPDLEKV